MELWDAYDENLNIIEGIVLKRGEPICKGCFHLVCDILVRHSDGQYLLMKRDLCKHQGGMWEASAGGSALLKETPLDCALRELYEETGIIPKEIFEIGKVIDENTIYIEFFCVTDCNKEAVVLQPGETIAYRWVDINVLQELKDELVNQRTIGFLKELQE